jgi:hypothetical protein
LVLIADDPPDITRYAWSCKYQENPFDISVFWLFELHFKECIFIWINGKRLKRQGNPITSLEVKAPRYQG